MTTELPPNCTAVDYTCTFCGRAGVAAGHNDCPPEMMTRFAAMLACNSCAYNIETRREIERPILKVLRRILTENQTECETEKFREFLLTQTRRWAEFICRLHGSETVWDPELVEHLMAKPAKGMNGLRAFENAIRHAPMQAPSPQPEMSNIVPMNPNHA